MKLPVTTAIFLAFVPHGFITAQTIEYPAAPPRVLLADINGDGIADRITVRGGSLSIALATAPGTYAAPVVVLTTVQDAAVGSFRANGINDIAILSETTAGNGAAVYMLTNDGTGTFTQSAAMSTGTVTLDRTCRIASGTFTERQTLDLAVVCPDAPAVAIGANDGTGNFQFIPVTVQTLAPKMQTLFQQLYDTLQGAFRH